MTNKSFSREVEIITGYIVSLKLDEDTSKGIETPTENRFTVTSCDVKLDDGSVKTVFFPLHDEDDEEWESRWINSLQEKIQNQDTFTRKLSFACSENMGVPCVFNVEDGKGEYFDFEGLDFRACLFRKNPEIA